MMRITNEQADYLLRLPKKVLERDQLLDSIVINQEYPFYKRFELISEQDADFSFLLEIQQSKKNSIRISFHHQENDGKTGLVRVDYNSGHKNPEEISDLLPAKFHPYAGKYFANDEHHIHYHVEGYKSLAWAIPLIADAFAIKEIDYAADFNTRFVAILQLFVQVINVETKIVVNELFI